MFVGRDDYIHMRVPHKVIDEFRRCGMLIRRRAIVHPLFRILTSEEKRALITRDTLAIIGEDLAGPRTVVCNCMACAREEARYDRTLTPKEARRQQKEAHIIQQQQSAQVVAQVRAKRKRLW